MSTKRFNGNLQLVEKIKRLRTNSINKKPKYTKTQLDKPVSFWINKDRLLRKKGK
jgi:hypothetical protein